MNSIIKAALGISLCAPLGSFAFNLKHGDIPVELGMFTSSQGTAQNINLQGFVGNRYTVSNNHPTNGLFGIGYFVNGQDTDRYQLSYGINGFYLGKTDVNGYIIQEHFATNLSYRYNITNIPVYFAAKAKIKNSGDKYNVVVDAGIGPNFMRTNDYTETPLNNFAAPNPFFSEKNNVVFSATAGIGFRFNNVFGKNPLTCGYRFFYLGQGEMRQNNIALLNSLSTGSTFANAVSCGVVV